MRKQTQYRSISIFTVLLIALLQGCATLPDQDRLAFTSGKIASSYYMVNKTVHYSEALYRVLWVETKSATRDFSGIWQPNDEFAKMVNDQLSAMSLHTSRISDLIDHTTLEKYYYSGIRKSFPPYTYTTNNGGINDVIYMSQYPSYPGFEKIRTQLRNADIRYLFEVLSPGAFAMTTTLGVVEVGSHPFMRIIDLKNKKVVWQAAPITDKFYQLEGDLSKLEANNLALLKEGITVGLKEGLASGIKQALSNK